jgi:hypothetical protein
VVRGEKTLTLVTEDTDSCRSRAPGPNAFDPRLNVRVHVDGGVGVRLSLATVNVVESGHIVLSVKETWRVRLHVATLYVSRPSNCGPPSSRGSECVCELSY